MATFPDTEPGGISCPTPGTCLVAAGMNSGTSGEVLITTDDGTTWQSVTAPFANVALQAIDCPSSRICLAGGETGEQTSNPQPVLAYTDDGGTTWSVHPLPQWVGDVNGISCPTTQICQVTWNYLNVDVEPEVAGALARVTDGGSQVHVELSVSAFGDHPSSGNGGVFSDVSCPSATVCEATAVLGQARLFRTTDGGAHWSAQSPPSGVGFPGNIWCTSMLHCVTSGISTPPDGSVAVTNDGGATWSAASFAPGSPSALAVTCPNSARCVGMSLPVANGSSGIYISNNGGASWSAQTTPSGTEPLAASCESSTRCFAVALTAGGSTNGVVLAATLPASPLGIVTSGLPGAMVGVPYNAQLRLAGGVAPYTWSLASGRLPAGLHLSAQGRISGTTGISPTTTFDARVTASHGATAAVSLQITVPSQSALRPNQTLPENSSLLAGAYHLTMQADGNLVEYRGTTPIWSTDTSGHPNAHLTMQGDGNLVLYDSAGHALWATGTPGHPGAVLRLQSSDGNLVVYAPNGTPLWASGT